HRAALHALDPTPETIRQYAEALAALDRFDEALEEVRHLARPDADEADALLHAYLLLRTGRTDEALAEFERRGARDGANPAARTPLALAALFAGRPEVARKVQPALIALVRQSQDKDVRAQAARVALLDETLPAADAEALLDLAQAVDGGTGLPELRGLA